MRCLQMTEGMYSITARSQRHNEQTAAGNGRIYPGLYGYFDEQILSTECLWFGFMWTVRLISKHSD